jgi:glycosyltransferase involved in cell wall biosynthesis
MKVMHTLERIYACEPRPAEVVVHVDQSDGALEEEIARRFPEVRTVSTPHRVGPGGGRHRCILAATQPFFASFDDDSWPMDANFFGEMSDLFEKHPRAAILMAAVFYRDEAMPEPAATVRRVTDYAGCGYGIRIPAYLETSGHVDRYCPYGIEEVDVALQLHALGWSVLECGALRVFHDTHLSHHGGAQIVAGTVQNVALRAYLRYPLVLWPRALLQLVNVVVFMMRRRRFAGLGRGLAGIPATLRQYSSHRRQLPADKVRAYLRARSRLN